MKQFQNYWLSKTVQERYILVALAILVSLLLVWSMLLLPLNRKLASLYTEVKSKQTLLQSLHHLNNAGYVTSFHKPFDMLQLKELLSKASVNAEISQDEEQHYRLSFKAFNFDKLMLLLEECYIQYGLEVSSLKVKRLPQAGFIEGEVLFK